MWKEPPAATSAMAGRCMFSTRRVLVCTLDQSSCMQHAGSSSTGVLFLSSHAIGTELRPGEIAVIVGAVAMLVLLATMLLVKRACKRQYVDLQPVDVNR